MEEARRKARSTSSTIFTGTDTETKGCYNQLLSLAKHYIQHGCRRLKAKIFGEKSQVAKRHHPHHKKNCRHSLQKGVNGGRNRHQHANGVGGVHYHHHHHHHIHHHHLHLCNNGNANSGTMATSTARRQSPSNNLAITNGDLNVHGDESRYFPNTFEQNHAASANEHAAHAQTLISAPPSIIIDEVGGTCDLQSQPAPRNNTTTALIIPDTTVVICHSAGALQPTNTQNTQLTTLSLFPSISKLHCSSISEDGDVNSDQASCNNCGQPPPPPSPNLSHNRNRKYESRHEAATTRLNPDWDSDYSDYSDSDCDCDGEDDEEKEEVELSARRKWINKKRKTIQQFCESDCFKVSIMTAIFLNTVTMAMEHYKQVCFPTS